MDRKELKAFKLGLIDAGRATARAIDVYAGVGGGGQSWLASRWSELAETRPLVALPEQVVFTGNDGLSQQTRAVQPIRVSSTVEIDADKRWRYLNNRMHVFGEMLDGIRAAGRTGEWDGWARRWTDPVNVVVQRALGREIYAIAEDGRHRAMMAAALDFPEILAEVQRKELIAPGRRVGIRLSPRLDFDHQAALEESGEVRDGGFQNRGVHWSSTVVADRDIDWWFNNPDDVVVAAKAFRIAHPDDELPTEMFDEDTWRDRFNPVLAHQLQRDRRKRWWRR